MIPRKTSCLSSPSIFLDQAGLPDWAAPAHFPVNQPSAGPGALPRSGLAKQAHSSASSEVKVAG